MISKQKALRLLDVAADTAEALSRVDAAAKPDLKVSAREFAALLNVCVCSV